MKTEVVEPIEIEVSDIIPDVIPDLLHPNQGEGYGGQYILDLSKLKTHEDIIKVLKHFSTRVVLDVFEIENIEQYVKPVTDNQLH